MLKYNNNMTTISINIIEPYLSYILNGQKIIEGRLNKGKFKDLKIGDILLIGTEKKIFNIERISIYDNFKDMLSKEGVHNVVPNKDTVEEAVEVYYGFYTKEQESKFGVLAIKIKE